MMATEHLHYAIWEMVCLAARWTTPCAAMYVSYPAPACYSEDAVVLTTHAARVQAYRQLVRGIDSLTGRAADKGQGKRSRDLATAYT